MSKQFKGVRLVDRAKDLIKAHGLTGVEVSKRYGVHPSWLTHLNKGSIKTPSADTVQMIIEDLTNKPLLPR